METVTFRDLRLLAAPGLVMTPRAATGQLVDAAVELLGGRRARVADVGTGSGAVAIAVAHALPDVEVVATDSSAAAVALARANVARLGLAGRVTVLRGDLLDAAPGPFDLVLANLPYLPWSDAAAEPGLTGEPPRAVFAAGDGLGPYRRLVAACHARLRDDRSALAIQLRRRVLTAVRPGLSALLPPQPLHAANPPTIAP